jgi:hypothetical protein
MPFSRRSQTCGLHPDIQLVQRCSICKSGLPYPKGHSEHEETARIYEFCPSCLGAHSSERKTAAVTANGKLGGVPMGKKLCRFCKEHRLAKRNRTGFCRGCLRVHEPEWLKKHAGKVKAVGDFSGAETEKP